MELVNKKYVRMHKFDIFTEMVKSGATEKEQDEERVSFFQNLLNVVMDYERNTKPRTYVEEFYVSVDDLDISDAEITRDTIVNALVYANITNDHIVAKQIVPYLYGKKYKYDEENAVLNYVLNHGIAPDEFIDGESEKLIFNRDLNCLEYGYIHNHSVKLERRKK